jgi:hypothetical protein
MTAVRSRFSLRRSETIVLCLVALLFTVATVFDLTRQVHIGVRLKADLVSWATITGTHSQKAFIKQISPAKSARDVVCGQVPPKYRRARLFDCVIFTGPVRAGHRTASGGYDFLAVYRFHRWDIRNRPQYRFGCYGDATSVGLRCLGRVPAAPG